MNTAELNWPFDLASIAEPLPRRNVWAVRRLGELTRSAPSRWLLEVKEFLGLLRVFLVSPTELVDVSVAKPQSTPRRDSSAAVFEVQHYMGTSDPEFVRRSGRRLAAARHRDARWHSPDRAPTTDPQFAGSLSGPPSQEIIP